MERRARRRGSNSRDESYPQRITYLIGPTGMIEQVFTQVEPATHPGEILESLILRRQGE